MQIKLLASDLFIYCFGAASGDPPRVGKASHGEVFHDVAWQAKFEAKKFETKKFEASASDESLNGIGSCRGVVAGGRRVRSRWSAGQYSDSGRGCYSLSGRNRR